MNMFLTTHLFQKIVNMTPINRVTSQSDDYSSMSTGGLFQFKAASSGEPKILHYDVTNDILHKQADCFN